MKGIRERIEANFVAAKRALETMDLELLKNLLIDRRDLLGRLAGMGSGGNGVAKAAGEAAEQNFLLSAWVRERMGRRARQLEVLTRVDAARMGYHAEAEQTGHFLRTEA